MGESVLVVLVTLLGASPLMPPSLAPELTPPPINRGSTSAFRLRVDLGGLLGASWFVPQSRERIEAMVLSAGASFRGEHAFDVDGLLLAAPAVGPLMLAAREGPLSLEDRALLISSGLLQLVGLSVGATALASGESLASRGRVLSFSPIAGGRLGLSMRLSGF